MKKREFSLSEIQVIKDVEELENDQLTTLIGGKVNPDDPPVDCKCGDKNCNIN